MKYCIKNGRVLDPGSGLDGKMDILIENGKIIQIAKEIQTEALFIDAEGKVICPGFIDMHTHMREPGFEYKETLETGAAAAAAGGFTTICCMPNTYPVLDKSSLISYVINRSRQIGLAKVRPIGAISKEEKGQEMSEMGEMYKSGAVAFSDDGLPVSDSALMRHAMDYSKMIGKPLLTHSEDKSLSKEGCMREGYYSTLLGLKGIPAAAEEIMVARDIILSELTGAHLHVCHISSSGTVDLIRSAKKKGLNVSCEVTPHHLMLTDACCVGYDTNYKVNPPLGTEEDRNALRKGLADGTIDCIATDHAPHNVESKECEFAAASFGITGLETAIPFLLDGLVKPGILSLERFVEAFTKKPADVLGIESGSLKVGCEADITILDLNEEKIVDVSSFYSKGKNTPLIGKKLTGWPYMTIVNGRIVSKNGIIISDDEVQVLFN